MKGNGRVMYGLTVLSSTSTEGSASMLAQNGEPFMAAMPIVTASVNFLIVFSVLPVSGSSAVASASAFLGSVSSSSHTRFSTNCLFASMLNVLRALWIEISHAFVSKTRSSTWRFTSLVRAMILSRNPSKNCKSFISVSRFHWLLDTGFRKSEVFIPSSEAMVQAGGQTPPPTKKFALPRSLREL